MNKGNNDGYRLKWLRVGLVINMSLAIILLITKGTYYRTIMCFVSVFVFMIPIIETNSPGLKYFSVVIYLSIFVAEFTWLSIPGISLEVLTNKSDPPGFMLNLIILILPWLYTGLRWICGLAIILEVCSFGKNKIRKAK